MINRQRLTDEFARLAGITSPPLREGEIARYLTDRLTALGGEVRFDNAAAATGGEVGNLIARFPAAGRGGEPLLLSVHMDTVEPGGAVVPVLNDGIFTSASGTILGADDQAGIAELIEALEVIREQGVPRGPVEVVVTIAEDIAPDPTPIGYIAYVLAPVLAAGNRWQIARNLTPANIKQAVRF